MACAGAMCPGTPSAQLMLVRATARFRLRCHCWCRVDDRRRMPLLPQPLASTLERLLLSLLLCHIVCKMRSLRRRRRMVSRWLALDWVLESTFTIAAFGPCALSQRQLLSRAVGFTGSALPRQRPLAFARASASGCLPRLGIVTIPYCICV